MPPLSIYPGQVTYVISPGTYDVFQVGARIGGDVADVAIQDGSEGKVDPEKHDGGDRSMFS